MNASFMSGIFFVAFGFGFYFLPGPGFFRFPAPSLMRVLGFLFVVIGLREFLSIIYLVDRNFLVITFTIFAGGLSVLGLAIGGVLSWRRLLERWGYLFTVFLQAVISVLILAMMILFSIDGFSKISAGVGDLIFSSSLAIIAMFFIAGLGLAFFRQAADIFKFSPYEIFFIFSPLLLNLTALCLYYDQQGWFFSVICIIATTFVGLYAYSGYFISSPCSQAALIDRNDIIKSMHLGWMVLDVNNKVIDTNPFIEIITGLSFDNLKGRNIDDWLVNSDTLLKSEDFAQNSFLTRVNLNGFTYIFDVRSQSLRDSENNLIGRLLLWQDITEQRKLEDARYRVLSTKINLMRSISNAANHITDIKIFLEAAIFQIVSSFGSLAGFIFVRDSDFIGDNKAGFRLEATYSYETLLDNHRLAQNFGKYIIDLALDFRAKQLQDFEPGLFLESSETFALAGKLLMCPIVFDENLQGAVCLYREENHPYDEDEVIGLEMITNELSMLVYVDHQRRQAVSFSERKKLVKDLHDTVTQQLYGLLYQIEIAQAQSELDGSDNLQNSLSKIGDVARQALREMRLFLHELRPIDLENEGLVSALHHRLTAVEGRANIHLRFISPESLEISKQQELNLYHIARESLNNVLRHSYAKNVIVQLKQNRKGISLEISDDGVGFDKALIKKSGGLGLKNIQGWASQIYAKLQIRSNPGRGTTIMVLVPRNN